MSAPAPVPAPLHGEPLRLSMRFSTLGICEPDCSAVAEDCEELSRSGIMSTVACSTGSRGDWLNSCAVLPPRTAYSSAFNPVIRQRRPRCRARSTIKSGSTGGPLFVRSSATSPGGVTSASSHISDVIGDCWEIEMFTSVALGRPALSPYQHWSNAHDPRAWADNMWSWLSVPIRASAWWPIERCGHPNGLIPAFSYCVIEKMT
jgi:hypothetical protein